MTPLLFATVISTALVGGIFYTFSSFVMGALARMEPREGMTAMQSINVVVLNPWFFGVFFGVGILCIVSVVLTVLSEDGAGQVFLYAGAALYLVGCIGVTAGGNVPLNDRLEQVDPAEEASVAIWQDYLVHWTRWNHVRTGACVAAAVAFALALAG